jgi:hypothetical protein
LSGVGQDGLIFASLLVQGFISFPSAAFVGNSYR